jgi:hypothetical protein
MISHMRATWITLECSVAVTQYLLSNLAVIVNSADHFSALFDKIGPGLKHNIMKMYGEVEG